MSRTLELCLTEVSRCQLFVGILGDRYGWVPSERDIPSSPQFDWVRTYLPGASATELEIHLAALAEPAHTTEKSFFYIRSSEFLRYADCALLCHYDLLFLRFSFKALQWLGSRAVSVLDSGAEGPGFKSQ